MEKINLSNKIKSKIQEFIKQLENIYKQDLISVTLYGSAASGEFVDKHSNLNLLVVLEDADLAALKKASKLVNKFPAINPLFFTPEYIQNSLDVFPIEFLDMQENYSVLFGKDILKDINIDTRNLRFQCEHELKVKLINLKQAYLRINKYKDALRGLLFKSFTSVLHILRNFLRIKGKKPAYRKDELLNELAADLNIEINIWRKILAGRNKELKLNNREVGDLFVNFVQELERIVSLVDNL